MEPERWALLDLSGGGTAAKTSELSNPKYLGDVLSGRLLVTVTWSLIRQDRPDRMEQGANLWGIKKRRLLCRWYVDPPFLYNG